MNPLTNMKNVKKLSEQELHRNFKTSWHDQYKDSAWIFVGGLPYDLTEGDIICVFSQYGEVVNINLVRDKGTGKQKGFCFICYEDQRSTVLAVDNLNGIKILNRTIRVDHVNDYKMPRQKEVDAETKKIYDEGCGPGVKHEKRPVMPIPSTELPAFARENEAPPDGFRLPPRLPIGTVKIEILDEEIPTNVKVKKEKKQKKDKKKKKSKKKHKKKASSSESSDSSSSSSSEEEKNTEDIKSSKQSEPKIIISDEEQKSPQKSTDTSDAGRKYGNSEHRSHKDTKRSNQFDERDDRRYYEHSRRYEDRSNERRDRRYLDEKDERKRRPDDRRDRDESKRYKR